MQNTDTIIAMEIAKAAHAIVKKVIDAVMYTMKSEKS